MLVSLLLVLSSSWAHASVQHQAPTCAPECTCRTHNAQLKVHCTNGGLTDSTLLSLLQRLPQTAAIIHIEGRVERPNKFSITRDFGRFKQLEQLHLVRCGLQSLGKRVFSDMRQMQTLDVSHNDINYLSPETFERTDQLVSLNLAHNRLGANRLPTGAFTHLKRLRTLSLAYNNITKLGRNLFGLGDQSVLESLTMDGNRLDSADVYALLADAQNLRSLQLNYCQLDAIQQDTFVNGKKIERLGLGFNRLSRAGGIRTVTSALYALKRLRNLDMAGNGFTVVDANVFYKMNISSLSLAHNHLGYCYAPNFECEHGIQKFAFDNLPLTFLDLSFNGYHRFESKMLGSTVDTVRILDISGNPLGRITAQQTAGLELSALHVAQIGLHSLPQKLPAEYSKLQLLNLSGNAISSLSVEHVGQLKGSLRQLDVSQCNLSSIPSYLHYGVLVRLDTAYLDGNPWDCHCHVSQLRHWLLSQAHRAAQLRLSGVQCASPPALRGQPIAALQRPAGCGMIFGASSGLTQQSEIGILVAILCGVLLFSTILVTAVCWGRSRRRKGTYRTQEGSGTNLSSAAESMISSKVSAHPPNASPTERLF